MDKIKELINIIENSDNIVFFGGAGVSTESDIPDFRSEDGLYKAKTNYGYEPERILSHRFFYDNTEVFYKYYKENLIYQNAKPNQAHIKLAELEKQGKIKAVITQNIDDLHQRAGSANVFELHGSVERNRCTKCNKFFSLDYIMDNKNCTNNVPICDECGSKVKPEVVLFGENLDEQVIDGSINAIMNADTLIIGGTSLAVYPAASFINYFRGRNLILINKDRTPLDHKANLVINDKIGKVFSNL